MRSRKWNACAASLALPDAAKNSPPNQALVALPLLGGEGWGEGELSPSSHLDHGEKMRPTTPAAQKNHCAVGRQSSHYTGSVERWLSGLRHTPGKRAWLKPTEGSNPSLSATSRRGPQTRLPQFPDSGLTLIGRAMERLVRRGGPLPLHFAAAAIRSTIASVRTFNPDSCATISPRALRSVMRFECAYCPRASLR